MTRRAMIRGAGIVAKKSKPRERLVETKVVVPPDSVKVTQARVKQCAFCKHYYIRPCDDKGKAACPNWLHLQSRGKKGGKAE